MKRKSSIQKKILIFVPVVIVAIVTLSLFSYFFAESQLQAQISEKMDHLSSEVVNDIDRQLISHQRLGESLSSVAGANGTDFSHDDYHALFERMLPLNEDTFGMGVWFEPYAHDSDTEYMGPYAYKDGENVVFTDEYETAEYDYPSHEWYIAGAESGEVSWTAPYFDEALDTTLITTSIPFYSHTGSLAGVISSDIDIGNLQTIVETIDTGTESGETFLLGSGEEFIVHPDGGTQLEVTVADDGELSSLHDAMATQASGVHTVALSSGDAHVYYEHIPRTDWTLGLVIPDDEAYAALNQLLLQIIIVSVVIILVFVMIALIIAKKITKPVKQLNDEVSKVASGDLSVHLEPSTSDEIGELTDNFNGMVKNIRELVTSVKTSIHTVADSTEQLSAVSEETTASSEEINRAMSDAANGASEAANHAESTNEQTVSLSEQLTNLVKQTNQLKGFSGDVQSLNEQGLTQMGLLKEKSTASKNVVMSVETVIQKLSAKMTEIGTIVNTISDISEQTNLLALNASIEAARAGEQGKGFAVVADEVRKLAEQTSQATENISHTIKKVQSESKDAEKQISSSREMSEAQNKAAEDSSQLFETISEKNDQMIKAIGEIGKDIDNIDAYKDNVVESISHIAAILQESAAASEEVSASTEEQLKALRTITTSAENLQESGEALERLIQRFSTERHESVEGEGDVEETP
ncbi:methyl-accepting chemotaxis protein [Salipaludibacillus agaradhaerens]|uniref:Methyl-accepting chemotaxis protein n=1 Tax=Salipaludibacillus agaradhaerens TaxID=76935 RepID=A0A9Q4B5H7_SALAG|nr:methyl-accepting chemotaxis protein [Salipaludibacillus agaradhaerens]MCR6098714.1 methyl-accepting chemotaxis protein [Salipaludibacillus agaradhaerens]MCR6115721.1 methyl-accepting chemotaxis protein [Salipaludibacillus agaradhaerens]